MANKKPNPLTRPQKITIAGIVVTSLIGLTAIWYSRRSVDVAKNNFETEMAFNKADNYLGFANFELPPPASQDTIHIIYGADFEKKAINISWLPFSICNYGHKDGEQVQLVIDYPKTVKMAILDTNFKAKKLLVSDFKRAFTDNENFDEVAYELKQLNPGLRITIEEPFLLHETKLTDSARTKDGYMMPFSMEYALIFSTTLLGKDLNTQRQYFSINCIQAKSQNEMIDHCISQLHRERHQKHLFYFVYPDKYLFDRRGDQMINEYKIGLNSLSVGIVDDTNGDKDIALALYNKYQKLESVRVYNQQNKLIAVLPAK